MTKNSDQERVNIIIMPDGATENYKSFSLKKRTLKIFASVFLVFSFMFLYIIVDYIFVKSKAFEAEKLRKENIEKNKKIAQLENLIKDLNEKLNIFDEYKRKLNIIAGLESPVALKEIGKGNLPASSYGKEIAQEFVDKIPQKSENKNLSDLREKAKRIEDNLSFLYSFFKKQSKILSSTPSIWPTKGIITSGFGMRRDPFTGLREFHYGLDIATQLGNPVIATADGTVIEARFRKDYGNYIIILHDYGYKTVYAHLKKILVKPGQRVKRGKIIGLVGSTGKSTAPHLHYEVRLANKPVNPLEFILEEDWVFARK